MAGKNQNRVTLREFRAAFNEVARLNAIVDLEMPKGFKKGLESVFPSRDPDASVTVRQFYFHARKTAFGDRLTEEASIVKLRRSQESIDAEHRLHLATRIMDAMPTLRRYFDEARRESAPPRRAAIADSPAKPSSLEDRVQKLERENAAPRQNSGRPTEDEDARVRRWYEEHDTRIGGDRDPGPMPGLRD